MVSSGNTAAMSALPTDSCRGRIPFCTVQASWDRVDESRTVIRGRRLGPDVSSVGRVRYRKVVYHWGANAVTSFNELTVDGYFMEFDDERSGGFAPLRFVPKGKYVVLGLVTSKKGELEAKDDIKRRIEEASKFVDIDQLCLSPQCGFSSTLEGNSLSRDQQIAKLRLVAETAEEVWGTPWC
jgi:methionine synthase II (cobalamin-independent)